MAVIEMVQNDTAPNIQKFITINGSTDGTGATVRFKLKNASTGARTNDAHNVCSVLQTNPFLVEYDFQPGDIPAAGGYLGDWEITTASGKVWTVKKQERISVRPES